MEKLSQSKTAKETQRFVQAVGFLLLSFSGVEGSLQAVLKLHLTRHLKKKYKNDHFQLSLASAIYGSMRFSQARDTIKRIMNVENGPEQHTKFAADIFQQMGNIQSLRDMLAHQNLQTINEAEGEEWTISDVFTTKDTMNVKNYSVSTEAIELAGLDATKLTSTLCSFNETSTMFSGGDVSLIPWQYKPSMLRLLQ